MTGRRGRHRGVGLVELLVALAISAALLTAVAVATDASFRAYAINEEQSNLMQRGRLGLNRLATYIRTCKEHQPINATPITNFANGTLVTDTGISMFNEAGEQIDVEFDAVNHRIVMSKDGTAHVLARGVVAFQVKMEPMKSPAAIRAGGDFDLLRRATILLTLQTAGNLADMNEVEDGQLVTLSSSVMPRRNAW
ncbi:MAG: prepilin-type N-terminal cleavage/methylation domain-containing protein [Anaerolineae bacterium]|nr:prepilin-type N-terminal cleavage/methylation domain-containing protein [Phycisphaerae bacterium]